MKTKIFFYILIIFHLCTKQVISLENKIILKVNNKIITTFDIEQEKKYLIVLNKNLKKIDQNKLNILAIDSIIKEKIKEIELINYYQLEKALDDANLAKILKNLYQTIGFKNENEFKKYLESQNLKFLSIKRKLAIEMLWNNLIFKKFNNRVAIDEIEIKNNLDKEIKNLNFSRELFLSEILIRNSKDLKLDLVYSEILESIKNVGFATTANIFSKSSTSKIGGKIGWVKETSLSKQIQKNVIKLEKGQISKPIRINENFLILKIDDTKINKQKIDKEKILSNKILFKRNQQLERFSLAYFSKVKQKMQINEL
ncbi:peptidylprolyl isomerase [Candidatus Pelagibacter bacterium]|jgi:peptidyl-prolyl cis-trans isomerase SurA|nr:peptidylprolyl isomerase [Candidatus Pelagibacter bacterium]